MRGMPGLFADAFMDTAERMRSLFKIRNSYPKSRKHPVKEVSPEIIANSTQFSRQQFRHDGRVKEFLKLGSYSMPRRIRRAIARDIVRRDYKWTHSTQVQEKVA